MVRHQPILVAFAVAGLALGACDKDGAPAPAPCAPVAEVDALRLNQLQVVGSHNSYRRMMYERLYMFVLTLSGSLPPELDPSSLDYDHPPLPEQLDRYGVRALELDLFHDPEGGRFYNRMGLQLVGEATASNVPELQEPGFKVLHIPDFDYETNHITFRSALETIRTWSDGHPAHLPLFIQIEAKDSTVADAVTLPGLALTTALPFGPAAADALDAEIRSVFPEPARLITPDEVRGARATLEEAVLAGAWPLVGASRGRLVFFMEGAAVDAYVAGAPGLVGRVIFTVATPGQEHAAFVLMNGPVGNDQAIADLVRRGYIVRTMADAGTQEARTGDRTRVEAALRSGAQVVSSDYYRPDPRAAQSGSGWTNYQVTLPGGGPGRANPVNGGAAARACE